MPIRDHALIGSAANDLCAKCRLRRRRRRLGDFGPNLEGEIGQTSRLLVALPSFRVVFATFTFLRAASASRSISHLSSFPPPSRPFLEKQFNATTMMI